MRYTRELEEGRSVEDWVMCRVGTSLRQRGVGMLGQELSLLGTDVLSNVGDSVSAVCIQ
jgi:hypothetical protein